MSELREFTLSSEGIHGEVMAADLQYYLGRKSIIKTYMSQNRITTYRYVVRSFHGLVSTARDRMRLHTDTWMKEMEHRGRYVAYIHSITFQSRPARAGLYASACGWESQQQFFLESETPEEQVGPTNRNDLGRGSFGVVQEVVVLPPSPDSIKMARKRIPLWRPRKTETSKLLQLVKDEVANLKSLDHPHIISLLGCYEESIGTKYHTFNLLMYPVCDGDLSVFLHNTENIGPAGRDWFLGWFICLSSALAYIHSKGIRHEDIKPQNIVHRGQDIFLTDFSSARKFRSDGLTSTENPAVATRLYAAPEAMQDLQNGELSRHGLKSDVYSLGLVFVEMVTVLGRRSLDDLHEWLEQEHVFGKGYKKEYHRVVNRFGEWFQGLEGHHNVASKVLWRTCIAKMLEPFRSNKPSAVDIHRNLKKGYGALACGCDTLQ
ncbi:kinase-like domain-containing protein [Clohesyomyces aquaticus]|uniref:non-specific serine/threonine protein kinase n=1 Tax=Clohesyomyces aquaticus TaxID=1231657 RepID=A0A1Y1ZX42_9PLEO|nr:kinase-like domain-containing protein [Clohesyomyces aquaticus]